MKRILLKNEFSEWYILVILLFSLNSMLISQVNFQNTFNEIPSVDILILIDKSGSMTVNGQPLEIVDDIIRGILSYIKIKNIKSDKVAIELFDDSVIQICQFSYFLRNEEKNDLLKSYKRHMSTDAKIKDTNTRFEEVFQRSKYDFESEYRNLDLSEIKRRKQAILLISDGIPDPPVKIQTIRDIVKNNSLISLKNGNILAIPVYFLDVKGECKKIRWEEIFEENINGKRVIVTQDSLQNKIGLIFSELGRNSPINISNLGKPRIVQFNSEFTKIEVEYRMESFLPKYCLVWFQLKLKDNRNKNLDAYFDSKKTNIVISDNWNGVGSVEDNLIFYILNRFPDNIAYQCDLTINSTFDFYQKDNSIKVSTPPKIIFIPPPNPIICFNGIEKKINFIFSPINTTIGSKINVKYKIDQHPPIVESVENDRMFEINIDTNGRHSKTIIVKPNESRNDIFYATIEFEADDVLVENGLTGDINCVLEFRILDLAFKWLSLGMCVIGLAYILISWGCVFTGKDYTIFIDLFCRLKRKFIFEVKIEFKKENKKVKTEIFKKNFSIGKIVFVSNNENKNFVTIPNSLFQLKGNNIDTIIQLKFREKNVSIQNLSSNKSMFEKIAIKNSNTEIRPQESPKMINLCNTDYFELVIGQGEATIKRLK